LRYFHKFFGHLQTVLYHKWQVFILMAKCGKPVQGFMHDMSKFSPVEFFESVKYYTGTKSPILAAKKDKGYSIAWMHHKGVNKHHFVYWVDPLFGDMVCVEIPWKYLLELICDGIAAGMTYSKNKGEEWRASNQLDYWYNIDSNSFMNDNTKKKVEFYYNEIADNGLDYFCSKVRKEGDYYED